MKTYNFKYGHGSVSLSLNEADILAELHGTETPPISDIRSALFASLEQPIDSAPLRQRVRPGDRVALVISDMTRFWMRQDLVVPHLVDYLTQRCGVREDDITIVIANGTHTGGDEAELRTLVTDAVYDRITVENHNCDSDDLVYLGTTPHGTPVSINRTAALADMAGRPSFTTTPFPWMPQPCAPTRPWATVFYRAIPCTRICAKPPAW